MSAWTLPTTPRRTAALYGGGLGARLARRFAERTMASALRDAFRRVVWVGEPPAPAPGRPLVLYANHHVYHDSFLLWHLVTRTLGRPAFVWMEKWETAPFFGAIGALPFPTDDARARVRAIRAVAARMRADARTALYLYPEGTMGPPEAGLAPFQTDFARLARLLPDDAAWWPVAVSTSWWGENLPTALLAAGPPHDAPDGAERDRLADALGRLAQARPGDVAAGRAHVLSEGRRGPDERWDLRRLAPIFRGLTFETAEAPGAAPRDEPAEARGSGRAQARTDPPSP